MGIVATSKTMSSGNFVPFFAMFLKRKICDVVKCYQVKFGGSSEVQEIQATVYATV